MPELSRFEGIIIRMYVERGERHHQPHFHVYYQEMVASYRIEDIALLQGQLPTRQKRLVEAWAELHQRELITNWNRLQSDQPVNKIDPLR